MVDAVSVVIPARDVAPWIGDQVRAVLDQEVDVALDLVVVDDGSIDGTGRVADAAAAADRRYRRIVHSRQLGASAARNTGVAATTGSLVAFCDGDDVAAPGWLAALVRTASEGTIVGGYCDDVSLNRGGAARRRPPLPRRSLPRAWGSVPYAMGANMAVPRAVLEEIGGWDEGVAHGTDVDLCARAQAHGLRIEFVPDAVVAYRHRSGIAATARQSFQWGVADSVLARRHQSLIAGSHNAPRTSAALARVIRRQDSLVRLASFAAGQLVGARR